MNEISGWHIIVLIAPFYWLPTFIANQRRVIWRKRVIVMNAFGFLIVPWVVALFDAAGPFASTEKDPWPEHEEEARRRIAERSKHAALRF